MTVPKGGFRLVLALALALAVCGVVANGPPAPPEYTDKDHAKCVRMKDPREARTLLRHDCSVCHLAFQLNETLIDIGNEKCDLASTDCDEHHGVSSRCCLRQIMILNRARLIAHQVRLMCNQCESEVQMFNKNAKAMAQKHPEKPAAATDKKSDAEVPGAKEEFSAKDDCSALCAIEACQHEIRDIPLDEKQALACHYAVKHVCDEEYHAPPPV